MSINRHLYSTGCLGFVRVMGGMRAYANKHAYKLLCFLPKCLFAKTHSQKTLPIAELHVHAYTYIYMQHVRGR